MSRWRIITIASVLVKSQLRAGRSGRLGERFFRSPLALLEIDALAFVLCTIAGLLLAGILGALPEMLQSAILTSIGQALIFTPSFVPGIMVVAGILFELSVSSKFATSDAVNWLPVSKPEYVIASAIAVAYNYSIVLAIIMGATVALAAQFGLFPLWTVVLLFGTLSALLGGTMVEILRAAVNRVGSMVYRRARRGALLLRLLIMVAVVLSFQLAFNVVFLIETINGFSHLLSLAPFVPLFWGSLAAKSFFDYNVSGFVLYGSATLAFTLLMLALAVSVRSRYWSPSPVTFVVASGNYEPRPRLLERLGLAPAEAALVRKDLKGFLRRRELLPYLTIPVVITAVLLIQAFATKPMQSLLVTMPIWFVGGFFALMVSSISFGQEGGAVQNLYCLPISPREVFRAKVVSVLALSLPATLLMSAAVFVITRANPQLLLTSTAVALLITVEETFVGLCFAARYPDFQERPRPRFVEPLGIFLAALTGIGTIFATATPLIVGDALAQLPARAVPSFSQFLLISVVFGSAVTVLSYGLARRAVGNLLKEYQR